MMQDTVCAVYDKLDELRDAFDTFLEEHDASTDPETEDKAQQLITGLESLIDDLQ